MLPELIAYGFNLIILLDPGLLLHGAEQPGRVAAGGYAGHR